MTETNHTMQQRMPRGPLVLSILLACAWPAAIANWVFLNYRHRLVDVAQPVVIHAAAAVAVLWVVWALRRERWRQVTTCLLLSVAYFPIWQWVVYAADALQWSGLRVNSSRVGMAGAFFIGLAWTIWFVERMAQRYDAARRQRLAAAELESPAARSHHKERTTFNPLDPRAWYYGRRSGRLNQSYTALLMYSAIYFLIFSLLSRMQGCQELYEMPAGGGEQKQIAQQVKIQKVIKKKFVVNPYSAINFKVPPIDEVRLQLNEITEHAYTVGYGEGAGAGFAGGTNLGRVRFIRLEYAGGDWDQDFGIGADVNMLIEYGVRTQQKVAKQTESRTVAQLRNFPAEKSPPMVYITGQRNISMSDREIKVLREYLLEKHGMIFGDNGGSAGFHNQFVGMMQRILPNVRPTRVPLDDKIHRIPYQIPFLPYVAPHGGKDALGWRVDGRLVCYYHPGDIGDAWADDHAGVSPEVYEACYQLGTNVIFYAHSEYAKWLVSRKRGKK